LASGRAGANVGACVPDQDEAGARVPDGHSRSHSLTICHASCPAGEWLHLRVPRRSPGPTSGKHRGTRTTMQIQCYHIGGGEAILWEMGEKEWRLPCPCGCDRCGSFSREPGGSPPRPDLGNPSSPQEHRDSRRACATCELSGRLKEAKDGQVESRLDGWVIQHRLVFASQNARRGHLDLQ
jgi:hypothetical protein